MLIVIRGLPGSGKSTTGRKVAEAFSMAFIEPDVFCVRNLRYHYTPEIYTEAERRALEVVSGMGGCDIVYADVLPLAADVDRVARVYGAEHPDLVITLECGKDYSIVYNRHKVAESDILRFASTFEGYKGAEGEVRARPENVQDMWAEILRRVVQAARRAEARPITGV